MMGSPAAIVALWGLSNIQVVLVSFEGGFPIQLLSYIIFDVQTLVVPPNR